MELTEKGVGQNRSDRERNGAKKELIEKEGGLQQN